MISMRGAYFIVLTDNGEKLDLLISKGMFPLTEDSAGNFICISLEKNRYGTIYFCDHEFEDSETEYMIQSKIVDNFPDFLKNLYIKE